MLGPLAAAARISFTGHMAADLLVGMVAPLRPVRVLTHPVLAMLAGWYTATAPRQGRASSVPSGRCETSRRASVEAPTTLRRSEPS